MNEPVDGKVVVITGASSGIGRAAAARFAGAGCKVVLAARAPGALQAAADEVGGMAVPTDVRDEGAVAALGAQAVEAHGRIDIWLSCAGVMAYGPFEAVPPEVFRGVVETNFFGQVHCARVA